MSYTNIGYDSFRLKIETHNVKLTNKGELALRSTFTVINNKTGEVTDENFKSNSVDIENLYKDGIKIKLRIVKEVTLKNNNDKTYGTIEKEYLEILLNSKILKEDYLKGITENTIKKVYDTLIEQDYFTVSYDHFLDSKPVDIDIKSDIENIKENQIDDVLKELDSLLNNAELTKKRTNKGLQLGYRAKTSNIISKPFVKFYSKDLELEYNKDSKLFADKYLLKTNFNLLRLEGTIKSNKHFQSILKALKKDTQKLTLRNILKFSDDDLMNVLRLFLSKYTKIKKSKKLDLLEVKNMELNKEQMNIYKGLKYFIMAGGNISDWLEDFRLALTKQTYYRYRTNVNIVYEILKNDKEIGAKIKTDKWIDDLLNFNNS